MKSSIATSMQAIEQPEPLLSVTLGKTTMSDMQECGGSETSSPTAVLLLSVTIAMRTHNPLNGSQGRTARGQKWRAATRKGQRTTVYLHLCAHRGRRSINIDFMSPLTVTLNRISPRKLDSDGWQAAAKPIRDAVADFLGCKDNDPRVTWVYAQERGKPHEHAVKIVIS